MYSNEVKAKSEGEQKKLESKLKRNMKHEAWKMENEKWEKCFEKANRIIRRVHNKIIKNIWYAVAVALVLLILHADDHDDVAESKLRVSLRVFRVFRVLYIAANDSATDTQFSLTIPRTYVCVCVCGVYFIYIRLGL